MISEIDKTWKIMNSLFYFEMKRGSVCGDIDCPIIMIVRCLSIVIDPLCFLVLTAYKAVSWCCHFVLFSALSPFAIVLWL